MRLLLAEDIPLSVVQVNLTELGQQIHAAAIRPPEFGLVDFLSRAYPNNNGRPRASVRASSAAKMPGGAEHVLAHFDQILRQWILGMGPSPASRAGTIRALRPRLTAELLRLPGILSHSCMMSPFGSAGLFFQP